MFKSLSPPELQANPQEEGQKEEGYSTIYQDRRPRYRQRRNRIGKNQRIPLKD
jgi:hypothetical protein